MSNPTTGPAAEITLRAGSPSWCRKAADCIIWLTGGITGKFSDIECRKLDETFRTLSARWNRC